MLAQKSVVSLNELPVLASFQAQLTRKLEFVQDLRLWCRLTISSTSACNTANDQDVDVLLALGTCEQEAGRTIRLCLDRFTAAPKVDHVALGFGMRWLLIMLEPV